MGVKLKTFDLGPGRVRGFSHRRGDTLHAAIQPNVSGNSRRCFEVELAGRDVRPSRDPNKFHLWPDSFEDIDESSVKATQRAVENMEPEWMDCVKELWEFYRDFTSVVFWSKLEPETVKAIAEILYERGEIPPDGDWS